MLIGNAIGMASGRNNIDVSDIAAACAGEFLIAIGCAGYGNNHSVVSVAKCRNAVAIQVNLTAKFATLVALISLVGASRCESVEHFVALVVRTRQTLDADSNALNLVVAIVGAGVVGSGGVVALDKCLKLGPLPVLGQNHKLGVDIACLHGCLWLVWCLGCFGNGERAINNHKLNIVKVFVCVAEIDSRNLHRVSADGCSACYGCAAESEIAFGVKFSIDCYSVTANTLFISVIYNCIAIFGDCYNNISHRFDNQFAIGNIELDVAEVCAGVAEHLLSPTESILTDVSAVDACRVARFSNVLLHIIKGIVSSKHCAGCVSRI